MDPYYCPDCLAELEENVDDSDIAGYFECPLCGLCLERNELEYRRKQDIDDDEENIEYDDEWGRNDGDD